jgi:hypothetical protein
VIKKPQKEEDKVQFGLWCYWMNGNRYGEVHTRATDFYIHVKDISCKSCERTFRHKCPGAHVPPSSLFLKSVTRERSACLYKKYSRRNDHIYGCIKQYRFKELKKVITREELIFVIGFAGST